jgi:hypothetical protein
MFLCITYEVLLIWSGIGVLFLAYNAKWNCLNQINTLSMQAVHNCYGTVTITTANAGQNLCEL